MVYSFGDRDAKMMDERQRDLVERVNLGKLPMWAL